MLAEIRVIPLGTGTTSTGAYIAKAIEVLKEHKVKYVLGPFGTSVEVKDFQELAKILDDIKNRLREIGAPRVVFDIAVDARFDKEITLEYKVETVEKRMKAKT